jgi:hypothetical protein
MFHTVPAFSQQGDLVITRARLEAAEGRVDVARALLEPMRARAARGHQRWLELEVRRTDLEIRAAAARKSGRRDAGLRQAVRALQADAARSGFVLFETKLATLAK